VCATRPMDPPRAVDDLRGLRTDADACFGRRAEALLVTGPATAPVPLSLAPVQRRGGASMARCGTVVGRGRRLRGRSPLAEGHALDVSGGARCDAGTTLLRPAMPPGPPAARAGRTGGSISWTAPLDVQRVERRADANALAAWSPAPRCRRRRG
jgi:hypothetical protein